MFSAKFVFSYFYISETITEKQTDAQSASISLSTNSKWRPPRWIQAEAQIMCGRCQRNCKVFQRIFSGFFGGCAKFTTKENIRDSFLPSTKWIPLVKQIHVQICDIYIIDYLAFLIEHNATSSINAKDTLLP